MSRATDELGAILARFCRPESWDVLHRPVAGPGVTYATDRCIAVRIPVQHPDGRADTGIASTLERAFVRYGLRADDALRPVPPVAMGLSPTDAVRIDDLDFAAGYLRHIAALHDVMISIRPVGDDGNEPAVFTFAQGVGLVMPMYWPSPRRRRQPWRSAA